MKTFRSKDGLRRHEQTHFKDKPFSCEVCSEGFTEKSSLDLHSAKHTGKLPFTCGFCQDEEGFKDEADLRKHKIEAHPEQIPSELSHVCEFCWNSFASPQILQEHVASAHEKYKCHVSFDTKIYTGHCH